MEAPVPKPTESKGLSFKRLDLHLHTPGSADFVDKAVTAEQFVAACLAKGLDAVGITDHNTAAWVDSIQTAAKGTALTVFPGAEVTCKGGQGGLHVIVLLDPSKGKRDVESLLSELGLTPEMFGKEQALTKVDIHGLLSIVRGRGGIAIPAHANSSKGIFKDMGGQQRIALVRDSNLIAVEATDFQIAEKVAARTRTVNYLDGSNPDYKRKLAVYQASDNRAPNVAEGHGLEGIGSRTAYFKMDAINLEGLRQCLMDPDVRIRQDYEYAKYSFPAIERIAVKGGFLDNFEAHFHEGLNCILGGKGAGKSLLIEFLRFALNQEPTNETVGADHQSKLASRLQEYGSVEVVFRDESGKSVTIKRTYRPGEDNPYSDPAHEDVARGFPVLFLSQNEILKIAESEREQIAFIDRFFDFRAFQADIGHFERELAQLDARFAESLRAYAETKELEKQLARLKTEIGGMDEALKNPVFERYSKLELQDRAFREQVQFVSGLMASLGVVSQELAESTVPTLPAAGDEEPALKRARDISSASHQQALDALSDLGKTLKANLERLNVEHARWVPNLQEARKEYDAVVEKEKGDYRGIAQRRALKIKEVETATTRLQAKAAKSAKLRELNEARGKLIADLRQTYDRYRTARRDRCDQFQQASNGKLLLTIEEATDVEDFRVQLGSLKRGSRLRDVDINTLSETVDPVAFVEALLRYHATGKPSTLEPITDKTGFSMDWVRGFADFLLNSYELEQILGLQYNVLPKDRPAILYHVGGGEFAPLNQLSIGQKCTAMLIMALSDGTMPIIIDQPEDSLDIRSVWEDMCVKIRTGKERRQFIFTTHNSSLAVASDSDKYHILEGTATTGRLAISGVIDQPKVNEEVLTYLEGGIKTYALKYHKYDAEARLRDASKPTA